MPRLLSSSHGDSFSRQLLVALASERRRDAAVIGAAACLATFSRRRRRSPFSTLAHFTSRRLMPSLARERFLASFFIAPSSDARPPRISERKHASRLEAEAERAASPAGRCLAGVAAGAPFSSRRRRRRHRQLAQLRGGREMRRGRFASRCFPDRSLAATTSRPARDARLATDTRRRHAAVDYATPDADSRPGKTGRCRRHGASPPHYTPRRTAARYYFQRRRRQA